MHYIGLITHHEVTTFEVDRMAENSKKKFRSKEGNMNFP